MSNEQGTLAEVSAGEVGAAAGVTPARAREEESSPPPVERLTLRARPAFDWSQFSIATLTLAGVGLSVVLAVQLAALSPMPFTNFLNANSLPNAQARARLLLSLGLGAGVPVLSGGLLALIWRARAARALDRLGRVFGPLLLVGILPPLFSPRYSHANQLHYVLLLSICVLALERLLRRSLEAISQTAWLAGSLQRLAARVPRVPNLVWPGAVLLAASFYAAYVGYFTLLSHWRIGTAAFDLGIYDNLMFNALHGRFFESPVLFGPAGGNYIAGHAEFVMLLFVPLYALRPGSETMLILQAVLIGFAAVPLYLTAATRLPKPAAALIAIAYLLYAPLHGGNFYDFHWLPLAIFFHFWLHFSLATKRFWLASIFVFVLLLFREDVSVGLALLGVLLLVTGYAPRFGLAMVATCVAWFVVVRFIVMPKAGTWYFQEFYNELFADGDRSFKAVVKTLVTNPVFAASTFVRAEKLLYILHLLAPLAFLPARRFWFVLLLLPGSFFTLLTTGYAPTLSISFQYPTHWVPYLFLATALALFLASRQTDDGDLRRRSALGAMLVGVVAHSWCFGALLQRSNFIGGFQKIEFSMTEGERERYRGLRELVAMIPKDATVAATENEVPHISARKVAYALRQPPGPVDYLLINGRRLSMLQLSVDAFRATMQQERYGLVAERAGEFYLFKRGHEAPEKTAAALQTMGISL